MESQEFNSLLELYTRLKPALSTKQTMMRNDNYKYIKIEDIWNYFRNRVWINNRDLTLFDMVDDILHTNNSLIEEYVLETNFKKDKDTNKEYDDIL